jgi:LacI family transcriptional regulator
MMAENGGRPENLPTPSYSVRIPRMVTLRQIAEEAGVSVQTVANVLQGRNKEQWPSVAERARQIREIASRLDYRPSAAAKSMRTRRSQQIGILILNNPDQRYRNVIAFETILGINEALEKEGYVAVLVRVGDVRSSTESRVFRERVLDGMIVLSAIPPDIERMVEEVVPESVWVDTNTWRPQRVIRRDERHAGRLAANALADLGYKKLVWFSQLMGQGANYHYSLVDRLAGVRQVVKKRKLELITVPASRRMVYRNPKLLADYLRPDVAIIAYSTPYARWLAHYAASLHLCPGYDFGLVCCDDSHDLGRQWPGLSRVTFDRFGMGVRAGRMMIDVLQGKRAPSIRIRNRWRAGDTAWGVGNASL